MIDVDVLIVGGGPAGVSLGYLLKKGGFSSCIVEKRSFPRVKLCGGLLTQKTVNLINTIFEDTNFPYEHITSKVNLFWGTRKISSVTADSKYYLVERADFDFYLIKKYLQISGLLFENSKLTSIDLNKNRAIINDNEQIHFKILVGADGANSRIRKYIDDKYRPDALCLECNLPSTEITGDINIYLSVVRSGYGWCFSKKNYYTVGIGGLIRKNKNLKTAFLSFLKTTNKTVDEKEIKGALVPFGKYVKKPCKDNILLIGDAAGFVDPITGEGIYFAMLSAQSAYHAIDDYLNNKSSLAISYLDRIRYIQNKIRDANRFNKLYFNDYTQSFLVKWVEGRKTMIKYICDNILSNYTISYTNFPFHYLKERKRIKMKSGNSNTNE
jgi:geranylgeranyl reductase family protein